MMIFAYIWLVFLFAFVLFLLATVLIEDRLSESNKVKIWWRKNVMSPVSDDFEL